MIPNTAQALLLRSDDEQPWLPIDMPTGRQHLPDWLVGLHISWSFGVANDPYIKLKVKGNPHQWQDQSWTAETDGLYVAKHPDGRALAHYHKGRVSTRAAWRVFRADDKPFTHQWRIMGEKSTLTDAQVAGDAHLASMRRTQYESLRTEYESCRIEARLVEVTEESSGYGGSHFEITMAAGQQRILRGPWHGGPPMGCAEVTTIQPPKRSGRKPTPRWHQMGGCFGLYIADDLLIRALAHFAPHVRLAHLPENYGNRIQPYLPQWNGLKRDIYELERQRAIRKEPAGEFWRAYWDSRGSYCGSLRIPSYGFRPEVTDLPSAAEVELAAKSRGY